MDKGKTPLFSLVEMLAQHPAVREKADIHQVWQHAVPSAGGIALGDDCAAIPQADGTHLLFAAEGMQASFLEQDPWFAGYSSIMVNLSDVAAMGGAPIALTDVVTASSLEDTEPIWEGMRAASKAYNVPIVGGHTSIFSETGLGLAVSVLGRAGPKLLTSFDAAADDALLLCIDLDGAWRGDFPFWNASTTASNARLRHGLGILPQLAKKGLSHAAKDVSNGGIPGTLSMLCSCSRVGARVDLDRIPIPTGVSMDRWLTAFPSFGYLLVSTPGNANKVCEHFHARDIACARIGTFTRKADIIFCQGGEAVNLSDALDQKRERSET